LKGLEAADAMIAAVRAAPDNTMEDDETIAWAILCEVDRGVKLP